MATDYISPWGGMPRTGTDPLYGYGSVPQEVQDHFANYMSSGGMNIVYQDPATGLYWQAQNTLGDGAGQPGNMYGGYRVYQPSWDGGFDVGATYDLFTPDGAYGGSEGFLKPSAQRTWNMGLASVLGAAAAGMAGAGAQAGSTAGTAAGEAGTAGLSAADLASMEMGMSVPAGADAVAAYSGLASPSLEAMAGAMGMSPEAFASLGAGGLGAAGAANGMLAGTAASGATQSFLQQAAQKLGLSNVTKMLEGGSTLDSIGKLAGIAAPLLGAAAGAQGQDLSKTQTQQLPAFLQQPVAGDLVPRVQGLLNDQMGQANRAGDQMRDVGAGLLGRNIADNGFNSNAVRLNAPTTATNPYLSGMADDIGRRTQEMLGQNNLAIQGNAVAAGGLGGSRQGVAQGTAAGKAADYLQGNLANLYGTAYSQDQNRALQQYGYDQNFYGQQRQQDLSQAGMGSGLLSQGLQTQWAPLQNAAQTYAPFTGFGTTSQSGSSGGGWQGALGGALGAAQLSKNMGWWG